ncbi:MAG: hypothetical protein E7291_00705 [Lachnospiraceae bacterium]|nr:hypothetical protein [Lachnospiraceae bacterium]
MVEKLKKVTRQCFVGEMTMPKLNLWLIGGICLLAGVVYGLLMAPATRGVTIGSNNGNQSNCSWGGTDKTEEATAGAAVKSVEESTEEATVKKTRRKVRR